MLITLNFQPLGESIISLCLPSRSNFSESIGGQFLNLIFMIRINKLRTKRLLKLLNGVT